MCYVHINFHLQGYSDCIAPVYVKIHAVIHFDKVPGVCVGENYFSAPPLGLDGVSNIFTSENQKLSNPLQLR